MANEFDKWYQGETEAREQEHERDAGRKKASADLLKSSVRACVDVIVDEFRTDERLKGSFEPPKAGAWRGISANEFQFVMIGGQNLKLDFKGGLIYPESETEDEVRPDAVAVVASVKARRINEPDSTGVWAELKMQIGSDGKAVIENLFRTVQSAVKVVIDRS